MKLKSRARMLFKIGLTVIVGVAVYMYYAINYEDVKGTYEGTIDKEGKNFLEIDKANDGVDIKEEKVGKNAAHEQR